MNHLLQAILDNPGDDTLRLVYADWLEEAGETAQAEFIRDCVWMAANHTDCPTRLLDLKSGRPVPLRCGICDYCTRRRRAEKWYGKIHWMADTPYAVAFEPTPLDGDMPTGPGLTLIVRRGFVDEVRCRLADWCGGVCQRCDGDGKRHGSDRPFEWTPEVGYPGGCLVCHGTGTVGGHGPAIVRAQPVTLVVTEKRPFDTGRGEWFWRGDDLAWAETRLPPEVFAKLPGGYVSKENWFRYYPSEAEALSALSAGLIQWAKGVAAKTAAMV